MTLDELLQQSRKQAEHATPLVRAAARLRIARVESATDCPKARITLEMTLEEIRNLPEPERVALFEHPLAQGAWLLCCNMSKRATRLPLENWAAPKIADSLKCHAQDLRPARLHPADGVPVRRPATRR